MWTRHRFVGTAYSDDPNRRIQQVARNSTEQVPHPHQLPFSKQPLDLLASYEVNAQIAAIEDLIAREADMGTVLRLLCLASITSGGIKIKVLENIKREILQVRISV